MYIYLEPRGFPARDKCCMFLIPFSVCTNFLEVKEGMGTGDLDFRIGFRCMTICLKREEIVWHWVKERSNFIV